MDNEKKNQDEMSQDTAEVKEVIMRAVQDQEFKQLLISDPDKALSEYNLTEFQKMLIGNLELEDLEKLTPENLEEYFSADSAVYTPDVEAELGVEEADEEDI